MLSSRKQQQMLTRGIEEKPSYNVGNVNYSGWMSQDGGYSKN
jgi:hypothetical protein